MPAFDPQVGEHWVRTSDYQDAPAEIWIMRGTISSMGLQHRNGEGFVVEVLQDLGTNIVAAPVGEPMHFTNYDPNDFWFSFEPVGAPVRDIWERLMEDDLCL